MGERRNLKLRSPAFLKICSILSKIVGWRFRSPSRGREIKLHGNEKVEETRENISKEPWISSSKEGERGHSRPTTLIPFFSLCQSRYPTRFLLLVKKHRWNSSTRSIRTLEKRFIFISDQRSTLCWRKSDLHQSTGRRYPPGRTKLSKLGRRGRKRIILIFNS